MQNGYARVCTWWSLVVKSWKSTEMKAVLFSVTMVSVRPWMANSVLQLSLVLRCQGIADGVD